MLFHTAAQRLSGVTWCKASHFLRNNTKYAGALVWNSLPESVILARSTHTAQPLPPPPAGHHGSGTHEQFEKSVHEEHLQTERGIGRREAEQLQRLKLQPDQPPDAKILRVAIIGRPNCGKSSLTNSLMGWRVTGVSKKVHTTRKNTVGIFTQGSVQIVFLDTPGILNPSRRHRHNLEKSLVIDPERSLQDANLVGVVVDVTDRWSVRELDPLILQVLHVHQDKTAVLILNKVDLLRSKEMLLHMTRILTHGVVDGRPVGVTTQKVQKQLDLEKMFDAVKTGTKAKHANCSEAAGNSENDPPSTSSGLQNTQSQQEPNTCLPHDTKNTTPSLGQQDSEQQAWREYIQKMHQARKAVKDMRGWPHFKHVFMVSALTGSGITDLRDYLIDSAKDGDWDYHSSLVTSQDPQEVIHMCVKEKLLEHLPQEIPYSMDMEIVLMEVDDDGILNVVVNIVGQNRRHVASLLRRKGQAIQKIASEAKQEMMNAFRCEMRLKLVAKVKQQR